VEIIQDDQGRLLPSDLLEKCRDRVEQSKTRLLRFQRWWSRQRRKFRQVLSDELSDDRGARSHRREDRLCKTSLRIGADDLNPWPEGWRALDFPTSAPQDKCGAKRVGQAARCPGIRGTVAAFEVLDRPQAQPCSFGETALGQADMQARLFEHDAERFTALDFPVLLHHRPQA